KKIDYTKCSRKSRARADRENSGLDIESTLSQTKQLPGNLLTPKRPIPAALLDFSRPFSPPEKELVPCSAEVLDSANMLEVIRDSDSQQVRLLYWNSEQWV